MAYLTIIEVNSVSVTQLLKLDDSIGIKIQFESDRVFCVLERILCRYTDGERSPTRAEATTGILYP